MNHSTGRLIDTVPWPSLEHAYGPATDLPELLDRLSAVKGRKLGRIVDELASRVAHQGSIYSASAPAVHVVIEKLSGADAREKVILYGFLSEIGASALFAAGRGPAPVSCGGGDAKDGEAILKELSSAVSTLALDLSNASAQIRAQAAAILTSVRDSAAVNIVRTRYFAESDTQVRHEMLEGLAPVGSSLEGWPDFLSAAMALETTPENRFLIRCAQVRELKSSTDAACIDELVSNFVRSSGLHESDDEQFYEALQLLGGDREFAALLQAFQLASDDDRLRVLAERLLRLAFDDRRTGWDRISVSRLREDGSRPEHPSLSSMALQAAGLLILYKLFPFAARRHARRRASAKNVGVWKIEYSGLQGPAPELPHELREDQRALLTAFAWKPELWRIRTNLWELFSLHGNAAGIRRLLGIQR